MALSDARQTDGSELPNHPYFLKGGRGGRGRVVAVGGRRSDSDRYTGIGSFALVAGVAIRTCNVR